MSAEPMRTAGPGDLATSLSRWPGRFAQLWLSVVVLGTAAVVVTYMAEGDPVRGFASGLLAPVALVGALIVIHDPRHPMGWIYLVSGTVLVLGAAADGDHWAWQPATTTSASTVWMQTALWVLTFPLMSLALLWYPHGDLPSSRWRWVAATLSGCLAVLVLLSLAHATADLMWRSGDTPGWWHQIASRTDPLAALIPLIALTCVASVVARYRSATQEVRDSIRWVTFAAAVAVVLLVTVNVVAVTTRLPSWLDQLGAATVVIGIPVAVGLTVLRRPTFDSRLVLARTVELVLTTLAAACAGVAAGGALALAAADPVVVGAGAGIAATAVGVATRRGVRGIFDHRLFGDRDDPLRVLDAVTRPQGTPTAGLDAMVVALASSLKLTHLAVEQLDPHCPDQVAQVVSVGHAPSAGELVVPLVRHGREVGRLRVSQRSSWQPLGRDEIQLLVAAADQIAAALENQRLGAEAQRARERLATAHGEERRRLRRELHDGLGAMLTGVTFHLEAAHRLLDHSDPGAGAALTRASDETSTAIADLRRVLEGMAPGPLEDLGLSRAVDAAIRPLLQAAGVHLTLSSAAPLAHPQALPAAVELAAYRIVCEAASNVARHASARTCVVRLDLDDHALQVLIQDDGCGSDLYRRDGGLGIASVRARVLDLGGAVDIVRTHPNGTLVTASLPARRRATR